MKPKDASNPTPLDFFPWNGKDPREIAGLNVKKCASCKIHFGDLGTGRCPSCNK